MRVHLVDQLGVVERKVDALLHAVELLALHQREMVAPILALHRTHQEWARADERSKQEALQYARLVTLGQFVLSRCAIEALARGRGYD